MSSIELSTLSVDDLKALIAAATAELAAREAQAPEFTIRIERGSYNHRRLGQPYIATATFDAAGKHTFAFGDAIGCRFGDAGELSIKAKAGDVVVVGQRDNKRADYSEQTWHIVQADGSLKEYGSKLEVIQALRA